MDHRTSTWVIDILSTLPARHCLYAFRKSPTVCNSWHNHPMRNGPMLQVTLIADGMHRQSTELISCLSHIKPQSHNGCWPMSQNRALGFNYRLNQSPRFAEAQMLRGRCSSTPAKTGTIPSATLIQLSLSYTEW